MEPGKGADGLLAPLTKTASARAIPALAVAVALALAGCGGDSDSDSGASGGEAAAAERSQAQASPAGGKGAEQGKQLPGGKDKSSSSGGAGKQGPPISVPSGSPEPGITPEERAQAEVTSIALASPALTPPANGPAQLPTPYTCDGKDSWPELRWKGAPSDTVELVLFAMGLAPVEGRLFFNWAVAGIDPALGAIEAGRLPKGAVMGRNGYGRNGYSICPPKGQSETYFFVLYALPTSLSARPGFDPRALREEAREVSGNAGVLAAAYAR